MEKVRGEGNRAREKGKQGSGGNGGRGRKGKAREEDQEASGSKDIALANGSSKSFQNTWGDAAPKGRHSPSEADEKGPPKRSSLGGVHEVFSEHGIVESGSASWREMENGSHGSNLESEEIAKRGHSGNAKSGENKKNRLREAGGGHGSPARKERRTLERAQAEEQPTRRPRLEGEREAQRESSDPDVDRRFRLKPKSWWEDESEEDENDAMKELRQLAELRSNSSMEIPRIPKLLADSGDNFSNQVSKRLELMRTAQEESGDDEKFLENVHIQDMGKHQFLRTIFNDVNFLSQEENDRAIMLRMVSSKFPYHPNLILCSGIREKYVQESLLREPSESLTKLKSMLKESMVRLGQKETYLSRLPYFSIREGKSADEKNSWEMRVPQVPKGELGSKFSMLYNHREVEYPHLRSAQLTRLEERALSVSAIAQSIARNVAVNEFGLKILDRKFDSLDSTCSKDWENESLRISKTSRVESNLSKKKRGKNILDDQRKSRNQAKEDEDDGSTMGRNEEKKNKRKKLNTEEDATSFDGEVKNEQREKQIKLDLMLIDNDSEDEEDDDNDDNNCLGEEVLERIGDECTSLVYTLLGKLMARNVPDVTTGTVPGAPVEIYERAKIYLDHVPGVSAKLNDWESCGVLGPGFSGFMDNNFLKNEINKKEYDYEPDSSAEKDPEWHACIYGPDLNCQFLTMHPLTRAGARRVYTNELKRVRAAATFEPSEDEKEPEEVFFDCLTQLPMLSKQLIDEVKEQAILEGILEAGDKE